MKTTLSRILFVSILLSQAGFAKTRDAEFYQNWADPPYTAAKHSRSHTHTPSSYHWSNWSGPYTGMQLGGLWVTNNLNETTYLTPPLTGHASRHDRSFLGGFYIGYNWQGKHLIYGAEADVDWTTNRNTLHCLKQDSGAGNANPGTCYTAAHTFISSMPWEFSARIRIGKVWHNVLVYLTGGLALAGNHSTFTTEPAVGAQAGSFSYQKHYTGGTAGLGAEYKLSSRLIARAEYRYTGYGAASTLLPGTAGDFWQDYTERTAVSSNSVRFGLSCQI